MGFDIYNLIQSKGQVLTYDWIERADESVTGYYE